MKKKKKNSKNTKISKKSKKKQKEKLDTEKRSSFYTKKIKQRNKI